MPANRSPTSRTKGSSARTASPPGGPLVYVAANRQNEVVRVLPGGFLLPAADAGDGLQFPSDVLFGTVPGQRTDLFVPDFAVQADDPEPGVLRTGF